MVYDGPQPLKNIENKIRFLMFGHLKKYTKKAMSNGSSQVMFLIHDFRPFGEISKNDDFGCPPAGPPNQKNLSIVGFGTWSM